MAFANGLELRDDVLFRSGEPSNSAEFQTQAMAYINRAYRTLAAGTSEFLPQFVDDWWWLRSRGVLILDPVFETGTVAVTEGSASITFSSPPAFSMKDWRFKVDGNQPEVYVISAHTGGAGAATLDTVYVGDTAAAATFRAHHVEYTLASDVQALISPMIGFEGTLRINGMSPEAMDRVYPLGKFEAGLPKAFALLGEAKVRLSHGGATDGMQRRIEYRYKPAVTDLTATTGSIPLVPLQYRHLLSDMALTFLLADKNDDRASGAREAASQGLAGMLKDNRRRLARIDHMYGVVYPRQSGINRFRTFRAGYSADGV